MKITIEQSYICEAAIAASYLAKKNTKELLPFFSEKELENWSKHYENFLNQQNQMYFPMLFLWDFLSEMPNKNDLKGLFTAISRLSETELLIKMLPGLSPKEIEERQFSFEKAYSGFKTEAAFQEFLNKPREMFQVAEQLLTELSQDTFLKKVTIPKEEFQAAEAWLTTLTQKSSYLDMLRTVTGKPLPAFPEPKEAVLIPTKLYYIPVIAHSEDFSKQLLTFPVAFAGPEEVRISRERAVKTLKVLADETRLALIELLLQKSYSGKELAELLAIRPASISHHIQQLREAGLLMEYREGNTKFFGINKRILRQTQDYLEHMKIKSH
ncbi:ArsR/SmtB family transcription factor [Enterococcus sp. BWR-S5]|uniref:ArsR/SmtB family transcription factor n=1 Tax=Enterococcus sp. BWR-S5 TaxID=2787714 RepID=UPI001921FE33|nr:metalloregulator ArsR/SmtB family transcription factor [Enterococcus sp. BWR-S5]MBL1226119.1 winged helix-turn-helix transcriptional regulator [Enterococcus sp. BWR-S5]